MSTDMPLVFPNTTDKGGGYSAAVRIELHVGSRVLRPSHTASDFLLFRQPEFIEPSIARLVIWVDGAVQESSVEILPHISPNSRIPIGIVR
jgi:hypothetical protein